MHDIKDSIQSACALECNIVIIAGGEGGEGAFCKKTKVTKETGI